MIETDAPFLGLPEPPAAGYRRSMDRLSALRAALAAHEPREIPALPGRTNHLGAGVLVPIVWGERPTVLAILRPDAMRLHPGEVAFPGGRRDPEDTDLRETALREANEELGIEGAEVLGRLSAAPLYTSDYRLVPEVALVPDQLRPNPAEVAEVLRYDLLAILDVPAIPAIPWTWEGRPHLSPVFPLGEHLMFGGTAYVFAELLEVVAPALGRTVPPRRASDRYRWEDLLR